MTQKHDAPWIRYASGMRNRLRRWQLGLQEYLEEENHLHDSVPASAGQAAKATRPPAVCGN